MPDLLHEYWENEDGSEFCPVREEADRLRPTLMPNAKLVFSLYAPSWFQAMQRRNEQLEYGDYLTPDGMSDHFYTDDDKAEQDRYLEVRNLMSGRFSS